MVRCYCSADLVLLQIFYTDVLIVENDSPQLTKRLSEAYEAEMHRREYRHIQVDGILQSNNNGCGIVMIECKGSCVVIQCDCKIE